MTMIGSAQLPHRARDAAVNLLLVLIGLVAAEALLHAADRVSRPVHQLLMAPWLRDEVRLPDQQLEYRGNPFRLDHDTNGYRNASALEQADIVTLGDSQTYGVSVSRAAAWPSRLANETGLHVYDMSLPGYGPAHSLILMNRALALRPRVVIVELYFGNDFYDDFALSKINDQISELIPPELRKASQAAERQGLLRDQLKPLFRFGQKPVASGAPEANGLASPRLLLSKYSKLYALVRALAYQLTRKDEIPALLQKDFARAVASLSEEDRRLCSIFEDSQWRTILTAPYRVGTLNDTDPRIRAGVAITLRALEGIRDKALRAGTRLLVLLLPTKESAFAPRVHAPNDHVELANLVAAEARMRTQVKAFLSWHDIPFVDPLPTLQASATQPYFESVDGHPNEHGHQLIADLLAVEIRRLLNTQQARKRIAATSGRGVPTAVESLK